MNGEAERRAVWLSWRIGQEVQATRRTLGWSQRGLGVRAGVPQSTVWRIEHGSRHANIETLCRITTALALDLNVRAFPSTRVRIRDERQLARIGFITARASTLWHPQLESESLRIPRTPGRSTSCSRPRSKWSRSRSRVISRTSRLSCAAIWQAGSACGARVSSRPVRACAPGYAAPPRDRQGPCFPRRPDVARIVATHLGLDSVGQRCRGRWNPVAAPGRRVGAPPTALSHGLSHEWIRPPTPRGSHAFDSPVAPTRPERPPFAAIGGFLIHLREQMHDSRWKTVVLIRRGITAPSGQLRGRRRGIPRAGRRGSRGAATGRGRSARG